MTVRVASLFALCGTVLAFGRCSAPDRVSPLEQSQPSTTPGMSGAMPSPPSAVRPLPSNAVLYDGTNSLLSEPEIRIIADAAGWALAWQQLHAGMSVGREPRVDFAHERVVLIVMGERTTGGHSIRATGVSDTPGGGLVLHGVRVSPAPGCMAMAVMTAPAMAVRLSRAAGGIQVQMRNEVTSC